MSRPNWPQPSSQATSSYPTIWRPTKARRPSKPFAPKARLAPVSAALQPRPQSDRDGLRQAQSALARQSDPNDRRPLARYRPNLRPLHPARMPKLLRRRRIRIHMIIRRSRGPLPLLEVSEAELGDHRGDLGLWRPDRVDCDHFFIAARLLERVELAMQQ